VFAHAVLVDELYGRRGASREELDHEGELYRAIVLHLRGERQADLSALIYARDLVQLPVVAELDALVGITAARLEALRLHALVSAPHPAPMRRGKTPGPHPPDTARLAGGDEAPVAPVLRDLRGGARALVAPPDAFIGAGVRFEPPRDRR